MTDKDALGAAGRLSKFCDEWAKMRHTDDDIQGLRFGEDRQAVLRASDIRTVVAALSAPAQPFDAAGVREAAAKECEKRGHVTSADAIRALPLPEAPASVEPVAVQPIGWMWDYRVRFRDDGDDWSVGIMGRVQPPADNADYRNIVPLYTHPEPGPASGGGDLPEAIRALPYDVMDDYGEVRRDERERIISRLQKKDDAQWFTTPNGTGLAAMKRAEQAIGAAISNGSMQGVERAYNAMRDLIDRAISHDQRGGAGE